MNNIPGLRIARPVAAAILVLQGIVWNVFLATAQNGGGTTVPSDVNVNIKAQGTGGGIFTLWWVWVLIAVFLIVIIALTTRSRGRTD